MRYYKQTIIETPCDFSFLATLHSHGWVQLAPFLYDPVNRRLDYPVNSKGVECLISLGFDSDNSIILEVNSDNAIGKLELSEINRLVLRIFGLHNDIGDLHRLVNKFPEYSWISRYKLGRFLASPTLWEDMVKTIATTNITWDQTIGICTNLVALGKPILGRHCFPTPDEIAQIDLVEFSALTKLGYRAKHVHELANLIISGALDLEALADSSGPRENLYSSILSLKGFGPYSAGNVLRVMGRHERLAIDSVVRNSLSVQFYKGKKPTDLQIERRYKKFGVWAGLIMWCEVTKDSLIERLEVSKSLSE